MCTSQIYKTYLYVSNTLIKIGLVKYVLSVSCLKVVKVPVNRKLQTIFLQCCDVFPSETEY